MAFDQTQLALVSSVNGFGLYRYDTLDAVATVIASGYINNLDDTQNLAVGDIVEIFVWTTAVRSGVIAAVGRATVTTISADAVALTQFGGVGGGIVQRAYVSDNVTRNLGSGNFPQDDSEPQIDEGSAYSELDIVYTPLDAVNLLHVQSQIALNSDNASAFLWNHGIFRSDETDAIAFAWGAYPATGVGNLLADNDEVVAGVITPITISVRVGVSIGNAVTQGNGTARLYGGSLKSWNRVIERTP